MDTDRESMRPGARNAVQVCMATRPADRVFILTDDETLAVGDILAEESRAITPHVAVRRLEEFAPRPLGDVPPALFDAIRAFQPTVFFYAAQGKPGRLIEIGSTEKIFSNPEQRATEDYITGRFG